MNCLNCLVITDNPKFCSSSCSASYNNSKKPKRQLEGICKFCKCSISSTRNYCKKCWKENKNKIVSNNAKKPKTTKFNQCLNCNDKCKYTYCSLKCSQDFKFKERVIEIEKTGFVHKKNVLNTSFAKRYLRFKFGDFCSICKQDATWNGKKLMLILDHIDGKSSNWHTSNIRLVCPNCDSQLPTFKSKNKGNGRKNRKSG